MIFKRVLLRSPSPCLAIGVPSTLFAQPGAFGGGLVRRSRSCLRRSLRDLRRALQVPPRPAKGGTKHTLTSVPRWDGLWVTAGNTHMNMLHRPAGFYRQGSARAC